MAIKKLLKLIQAVNIAEDFNSEEGENELMMIGQDVIKQYDVDWSSMDDWKEDIEEGRNLIKPPKGSKSQPWQGASNFKTPILIEARLKFGDRASEELIGNDNLVKSRIVGKDPDGEKADRMDRVQTVMNWQLTVEDEDWLDDHDTMLYDLSDEGHIFKKTFFDPSVGHNVSEVIQYPNFAINQKTKSLEKAEAFTHRIFKTPRQIQEMINAGIWRDVEIEFGAVVNEDDNTQEDADESTEFYEQQTFLDLDEDGYDEPYLVTVHAASGTVMRIKTQISIDGIFVRDKNGLTTTVDQLILKDQEGTPVFDENEDIQLIDPDKKRTIVKISRERNLTPYGFLKNPQKEYLSVGYFHILGAYANTINATTNQLTDAGTLANLPTGWLAKNFRKRMGEYSLKPGSLNQTNLSPQDLKSGILMNTFGGPSPALMQLNDSVKADAQRLSSTTDLGSVLGSNTPAATTLSLVHEQQQSVGAIILRIWRAMTREFAILYRLNSKYMDPELYANLVDDEEADPFADFNTQDMDIVPSANPRNSSKIQRIQKAEAELGTFDRVQQTGGNTQEVVKSYYQAIGSENIDKIYPELTEDQAAQASEDQKRQKQLAEMQIIVPLEAQAALGRAEELKAKTKFLETQIKAAQIEAETGLTVAKIATEEAKTQLTIEQAETESTKNATNIVGAELNIAKANREAALADIDRGQANAAGNQAGNNPRPA